MKIHINGEDLPFQLEKEKTLGEVLQGLESWLKEKGWSMRDVLLNGQSEPDPSLGVDLVESLSISALPEKVGDLATVLDYLALLEKILYAGEKQRMVQALENFGEVLEAFPRVFGPIYSRLESAALVLKDWSESPWEKAPSGKTALRVLGQEGQSLLNEALDPIGAFENTRTTLSSFFPLLEKVPLQFQMGQDGAALTSVLSLLNILEDLVRQSAGHPSLAPELKTSFKKTVEELNTFLKDLQSAFENKDMVTISDLLEYEITPRLKSFEAPQT